MLQTLVVLVVLGVAIGAEADGQVVGTSFPADFPQIVDASLGVSPS